MANVRPRGRALPSVIAQARVPGGLVALIRVTDDIGPFDMHDFREDASDGRTRILRTHRVALAEQPEPRCFSKQIRHRP